MKQLTMQLVEMLRQSGWHLTIKADYGLVLSEQIKSRYTKLPEDYTDFLCYVARCVNADETAWFLCESDFNGDGDSAFSWDEPEIQSLEAAKGDDDLTKATQRFWSDHLPIAFSVKSGYAFLGLELAPESFGAVVCGREPEYEDAESVCASFSELIALIGSAADRKEAVPQLDGFI